MYKSLKVLVVGSNWLRRSQLGAPIMQLRDLGWKVHIEYWDVHDARDNTFSTELLEVDLRVRHDCPDLKYDAVLLDQEFHSAKNNLAHKIRTEEQKSGSELFYVKPDFRNPVAINERIAIFCLEPHSLSESERDMASNLGVQGIAREQYNATALGLVLKEYFGMKKTKC